MKKNLAVLITCHNRLEKTRSVEINLFSKRLNSNVKVFLVDDGVQMVRQNI